MKNFKMMSFALIGLFFSPPAHAQTIGAFKCIGSSTVPSHTDSFYHFEYDGNLNGKVTEEKNGISVVLAGTMTCTIVLSIPPPRPVHAGPGDVHRDVVGLSCNSWIEGGPATGYQVNLAVRPSTDLSIAGSTMVGPLQFFIDDNSSNISTLPNPAKVTLFACDPVEVLKL